MTPSNEIKLFLKKTGFFLLLFFLAVVVLDVVCNLVIKSKADFKLKSSPEYAVFGNSRPECAFNDSLIENFKNFSESGENYFFTRIKIREIIKQNPDISTVFIEFGKTNIDKNYTTEKILRKENISYRNPIFSPFLELNDYNFFFSNGIDAKRNMIQTFPISLRRKVVRIARMSFDYTEEMGGYLYLERNKTDSLVNAYEDIETELLTEKDLCIDSIKYLREIIDFCKENNTKIYIIRCPIHNDYPYYASEEIVIDVLQKNYFDVTFLDFSKFPSTNREFGDVTHLNHIGATRFSVWFDYLLKNNLLEKDNPQGFINSEIDKILTEQYKY